MIYPNAYTKDFIYNLFCDAVLILAEDKDWADVMIPAINTKDFDLYGFDKLFEFAKNHYMSYGVAPSIEDYKAPDSADEVKYIADFLKGRTVTQERADEVKEAIRCWNSYRALLSIWNTIGDNILQGVESDAKMDAVIDKVKTIADSIQHTRIITNKVEDEWV